MALAAQTAGGSVAASAKSKKTTDSTSSVSTDSENESTSSDTKSTDSDVSGKDLENAMESAAGVTADGAAKKEETVYVFTDAKGSQKKITVSNWLKNENGDDTLNDETTLDDVENVEGDETFKQDGDKLTWDAKGNDIYYQGRPRSAFRSPITWTARRLSRLILPARAARSRSRSSTRTARRTEMSMFRSRR